MLCENNERFPQMVDSPVTQLPCVSTFPAVLIKSFPALMQAPSMETMHAMGRQG